MFKIVIFKIVISQRNASILPSIFLKVIITFKDSKLAEKNSLTFSESKFPLNISGVNRPFWLGCLFSILYTLCYSLENCSFTI